MQIICVVARTASGASVKVEPDALQNEVNHARSLYAEAKLRQIWSRPDAGGAIMLLEVEGIDEARELVAGLPLAKAGVIHLEVAYPLVPYKGFGPAA